MKFLLITRHFPPVVTAGARRPYLIARALMAAGVEVRVLAPSLPKDVQGLELPHPMAAPLPAGAGEVQRKGLFSRTKDFIRAELFLPDPDIRWCLRAASAASATFRDFAPDWVMTTSPPESVHVSGLLASRKLNARWIADFRDHWLVHPLLRQRDNPLRRNAERVMAKAVLRRTDILTAAEKPMLDEMSRYAPDVRRLHLPQPAPPAGQRQTPRRQDLIRILHTGSFSLSHDKRSIDDTLALFEAAYAADPRFRLVLRGRLTTEERNKASGRPGVEVLGVAGMEQTWQEQRDADVLLLVAAQDAASPPGKLAEYLAAGPPIVCLGGGPWKASISGALEDPLTALLSLREPSARQAPDASAGQETAALLIRAMEEAQLGVSSTTRSS